MISSFDGPGKRVAGVGAAFVVAVGSLAMVAPVAHGESSSCWREPDGGFGGDHGLAGGH